MKHEVSPETSFTGEKRTKGIYFIYDKTVLVNIKEWDEVKRMSWTVM